MDTLQGQTISAKIFICGDVDDAKRALRRYCIEKGACVAIY